jgi:peptide/nickel transport system permease protein
MACVMMFAVLTLIGNLIADVLYGVMDPRVRFD